MMKSHFSKISRLLSKKFDVNKHISIISSYLRKACSFCGIIKFYLPQKVAPAEIKANFEKACRKIEPLWKDPNDNELASSTLRSISLNYIQRPSASPSKALVKVLDRLKKLEDIVVTKPDRGSGIVVMAKSEYVRLPKRSFNRWIGDATKFARIDAKRPKRGGAAHIKVKGMNLVSLWGVNCRFWSQLGCLWCKVTICPSRYRLVLCIKKFTKNALTLTTEKSPLGVSLKLEPHPHWIPFRGLNLNFPTSILVTFRWESPGMPKPLWTTPNHFHLLLQK